MCQSARECIVRIMKQYLLYFCFLFAVVFFFWHWHIYAFSRYPMEGYDEAIRYISRAYVRVGRVPYHDFGIVYSPGVFLLAHIVPFRTLEQQHLIFFSFFPLLIVTAAILMTRFHVSAPRFVAALSGFMILLIPLLHSENIADPLLALLILATVLALRQGTNRRVLLFLFLLPCMIIYWRWDRILTFLCIEFLLFIPLIVFFLRRKKYGRAQNTLRVIGVQTAGLITGLIGLAAYLFATGGLRSGVEFIYYLPAVVILEYRDLPLPDLFSFPGSLFLCTWVVLVMFLLYMINESVRQHVSPAHVQKSTFFFLVFSPLAALPYALGRSDGGHIWPMLFLTGISILYVFFLSESRRSYVLLVLLVPLVAASVRYLPSLAYEPQGFFSMTRALEASLHDCRKKTGDTVYRSLFVGRTLYERFFFNNVVLYFLNPSIPPASRHIHDDPGVQNSCVYGTRIAGELDRAPKPMLAFITDKPSEKTEENKTQEMKSCGKIERYLTTHPYRILGQCTAYDIPYEIRLYE